MKRKKRGVFLVGWLQSDCCLVIDKNKTLNRNTDCSQNNHLIVGFIDLCYHSDG